jgi:hypothetical protein
MTQRLVRGHGETADGSGRFILLRGPLMMSNDESVVSGFDGDFGRGGVGSGLVHHARFLRREADTR